MRVSGDDVLSLANAIEKENGNYLGVNTQLIGSGSLILENTDLTIANATNAFNERFTGQLDLLKDDGQSSLLSIESGKLEHGDFVGGAEDIISFEDDAGAVFSSTGNGADLSDFSGTVSLGANDYTFADEDAIHASTKFEVQDSQMTFGAGYDGTFNNQVQGKDDTSLGSWILENGANVTVGADSQSKKAITSVKIDGTETKLHLINGTNIGALQQFADKVVFSGNGILDLSNYVLSDGEILLGKDTQDFTGILSLSGDSQFTITKESNDYGSAIGAGSELIIENTTTLNSLTFADAQETTEAKLTLKGDSVLHVKGGISAGSAAHVTVEADRGLDVVENQLNILAQDEGWVHTLITAESAQVQNNSFHIVVGDEAISSGSTISHQIQDGVSGTYERDVYTSPKEQGPWELGISYRLTELFVDSSADLTLTAQTEKNATDLNNVLLNKGTEGSGNINVENHVVINASEGSSFDGQFTVLENSTLTLNGADVGHEIVLTDTSSALIIDSNQTMALDATQGGQLIIEQGRELTLTTESNTLGTASDLMMTGSGTLRLDSNTKAQSDFAMALFNNFEGRVLLDQDSFLTLSESDSTLVNLSALSAHENSTELSGIVQLDKGHYEFSTNSSFDGMFDIGNADLALISDGDGILHAHLESDSGNLLATVSVSKGNTDELLINADQAVAFNGEWAVQDGATLHIDQTIVGGNFTIEETGVLKVSGSKDSTKATSFANDVSGGGNLLIDSGYVLLEGAEGQLNNKLTAIAENAQLTTTDYDTLGSDGFAIDGRLVIKDADENGVLTLNNLTATGSGILQVDAGDNGSLVFGSADLTNFTGEILLSGGTYTYDPNNTGLSGSSSAFGVALDGVFKVNGSNTVNKEGSTFIFDSVLDENGNYIGGGTIDLTEYTGDLDQPAMTVGKLQVNAAGDIKIDAEKWFAGSDGQIPEGEENVLDADDGQSDRFILVAGEIAGVNGAVDVKSQINLVDKNGNPITDGNTTKDFVSDDTVVAVGHWGYGANIVTDGDTKGVAIGYQLTQIDLKTDKEKPDEGLLVSTNRDNPKDTTNTLSALITGNGTMYIDSSTAQGEQAEIRINHINNTFSGKVIVEEGSHLVAAAAYALGSGNDHSETDSDKLVSVTLNEYASLTLENELGTQRLANIEAKKGSTVSLSHNTLYLVGNKDYETHFEKGSNLSGSDSGELWLFAGKAIFEDAAGTLNNFLATEGTHLTVGDGATIQLNGDDDSSLELSHLRGWETASASIGVDTVLGDNRDFSGLYEVNGHTLTMSSNKSHWNTTSSVTLLNSATWDLSNTYGQTSVSRLEAGKDGKDSTIRMGTVELFKPGQTSTSINATTSSELNGSTFVIDANQEVTLSNANELLAIDAVEGVNTEILTSQSLDIAEHLSLIVQDGETLLSKSDNLETRLVIGGEEIGTLTYGLGLFIGDNSIAVNSRADTLALDDGKTLSLSGRYDPTLTEDQSASILDLQLVGGLGTVAVANGSVKLAQENSFGNFNIATNANAYIDRTQSLNKGISTFNGLLHANADIVALEVNKESELVFNRYQSELEGTIKLNGGVLSLNGNGNDEYDASLLAGTLLVSDQSTLNISNIKATIGTDMLQTDEGKEGGLLSVNVTDGSYITINKAQTGTVSSNTVGAVTVGDNDPNKEESTLRVTSDGAGFTAASQAAVTVNQNGTLHYDLTVTGLEAEDQVTGRIDQLSGNGKLQLHLLHEDESSSDHLHEVVFTANDEEDIKFSGTFSLINGEFTLGSQLGKGYEYNNQLAQTALLEAGQNSIFRVIGETKIRGMTLTDSSTLDLSQIDTKTNNYGSSSNKLSIAQGEVFRVQSGSTIQINTGDFTAETTLHGAITSVSDESGYDFASVVNSNADKYEKKFFQIIDGKVEDGSRVNLKDENGNNLTEQITVDLYDQKGTHLADMVGGWSTIADDSGLYIGQKVQGIRLDKTSIDLFSEPGETVTLSQWIESKNESVDLNITKGSVALTADATDFAGDVIVHENANLIVGASGALGGHVQGTSSAGLVLDENSTVQVAQFVTQSVSALSVAEGATLKLADNSNLTLAVDSSVETYVGGNLDIHERATFNVHGSVVFDENADLSAMNGTIRMNQASDSLRFTIGENKEKSFTSGKIDNGLVVKDGAGSLQLGLNQFAGTTAIAINEGSLSVNGWGDSSVSLHLSGFSLSDAADDFILSGDMNLGENGTFINQGSVIVGGVAENESQFVTRHIQGNWSGNGTIVFDAGLGLGTSDGEEVTLSEQDNDQVDSSIATYGQSSDLLVIHGSASGNAVLRVNNINSANTGKLERMALLEVGDDSNFNPTLYGGSIEAGGYSYHLVRHDSEGGLLDIGADYILTSYSGEGSSGKGDRDVSVNNGAFIGFAAASQMFDLSIHDRQGTRPYINPVTGENTQTSMWMRQSATHDRSHDSSGQLTMRATSAVTQIGGDIVQLNTESSAYVFAGLMAGWGTENLKSRSSRVEAHSKADIDGWNIGVYGGWHHNDPKIDRTGAYVNGWLQYTHLKGEFENHMDSATARASGLSASLEAGWNICALSWENAGHADSGFFIEPRAQVTWWGTDFDDMQMSGDVEFLGKNNLTTKLGVRTSAVINGNSSFVPYAEVNWIHNTHAYGTRYGEVTDYQAGTQNLAELKAGVEFEFRKNWSGYGQFAIKQGSDSYTHRSGSVGVKYRF